MFCLSDDDDEGVLLAEAGADTDDFPLMDDDADVDDETFALLLKSCPLESVLSETTLSGEDMTIYKGYCCDMLLPLILVTSILF